MLVDGHIFIIQINGIDLNASPGDLGRILIPQKCELLEAGVFPRADVAGTPRVKFDTILPNLGDRGDGDAGDCEVTTNSGGIAACDTDVKQILTAGTSVVVQLIDAAGGALLGDAYLMGRWLSETTANQAGKLEVV